MINDLKIKSIFDTLDWFIDYNSKIAIWISGWSDSMFLFYLINKYRDYRNYNKENIYILHYNHNFRKESKKELLFMKKYFKNYNFIFSDYLWNNYTENILRKNRYLFFEEIINDKNIDYLLLWHNLTDRIETTFLNLIRWCNINGFLNMKFASNNNISNYRVLRPLISITKDHIKAFCDSNNINYFEDYTNDDENISQRNFVRKNIIKKINLLKKNNLFYSSFDKIYNSLELNFLKEIDVNKFKKIFLSKYCECEYAYFYDWNIFNILDLIWIFEYLNIYYDVKKSMLEDFLLFLTKNNSWYKYINWVYFFKSYGKIYIIKWNNFFWEKNIEEERKINTIWLYKFGDFDFEIKEDDQFTVRFIKRWDKIYSKSVTKYLNNQKIPIFWRKFVPVLVCWDEIKKVFIHDKMKWYI